MIGKQHNLGAAVALNTAAPDLFIWRPMAMRLSFLAFGIAV